jgi:hypothetical protein
MNFKTFRVSCTGDGSEYVRKADTVQQDAAIKQYALISLPALFYAHIYK